MVVKWKFSKFFVLIQHPWNGPFLGGGVGLGSLLPQILFDLAEILNRGILPIRQTHCLENPSKFWISAQMEHTQSYSFGPFWDPIYYWKTKTIS